MRTVVAKFGGTSLADAGQFRKIKDIVSADPDRRVLVVSAPGKRFPEDIKVTDLLAECYEEAAAGKDFHAALSRVKARYSEILSGLSLDFPLDEEIKELEKHLAEAPEMAYTESRGEYLNARIMAQYLGFTFVDPAWCVCFHEDGTPDAGAGGGCRILRRGREREDSYLFPGRLGCDRKPRCMCRACRPL